MRYLPPIRWFEVAPGMLVMGNDGVPRTVLNNERAATPGHRVVKIEGIPGELYIREYQFAAPVELDEADAVEAFQRAGFTIEKIEES